MKANVFFFPDFGEQIRDLGIAVLALGSRGEAQAFGKRIPGLFVKRVKCEDGT